MILNIPDPLPNDPGCLNYQSGAVVADSQQALPGHPFNRSETINAAYYFIYHQNIFNYDKKNTFIAHDDVFAFHHFGFC